MKFFRDTAFPLFLSVLVHLGVLALVVYGFLIFRPQSKPQPPPQLAIEAEVVDESRIRQEVQRLEREEQAQARRQREEQQRAEELKREREAEEQRLEEVRRQRAAEEQAERQRAEQRQREEEQRAKLAAEQEAKRKAEQVKAEQLKAEQVKAAAAEKKRKEAEARKQAEEARQRAVREAELKRQLAEEEHRAAAVNAGLLAQYVAQIQASVQRAWLRPPSARAGLDCVVYVTQVPGGEVGSVRVGECNGDEIVRQSIEAAVYRASPLPVPPDPALFERNLRFNFKPDE